MDSPFRERYKVTFGRDTRASTGAGRRCKTPTGLNQRFIEAANALDATQVLGEALEARPPHPTDTHPTIRQRLEALDVSPEVLARDRLDPRPTDPALALIDDPEALEEAMTADLTRLSNQERRALGGSP